MKRKLLAMMALAAAVGLPGHANPVEYQIPATQAEFEQQWETVPGTEDFAWEWVDDTTPYAQIQPTASVSSSRPDAQSAAEGKTGATLILAQGFEMKAGEIYYIYASACTADYNDDEYFSIVFGTDKNNLDHSIADQHAWRNSGLSQPNFKYYPSSESYAKFTVTEDGTYYIGVRSQYGYGSFADKYLQISGIKVEKDVDYPSNVTNIKITPDETGAMAATITWKWPTKTKNSADLTSVSGKVYRSTSSSLSDAVLLTTITDAVPGSEGSYIDNETNSGENKITEGGDYYYMVTTFNDDAENTTLNYSNRDNKYIGPATKCQPILNNSSNPAVAKMVDEQTVMITFTPRKEAVKGVLTDPDAVFLKVLRKKGNEEAVELTANAPMESPWYDNTLTEPGIYTYSLYVTYKGEDSSETKLTPIFAGGTVELPYSETFDTKEDADNMTILCENSSNKWEYNSYYQAMYCSYYSSYYASGVVTPPVKVEKGKTYRVACTSWLSSSSGSKDLTLKAGTAASYDELKDIEVFKVESNSRSTFESFYSPDESGLAYFCFNVKGGSPYIYLDDIMIEESVLAPATVADLVSTPDNAGANSATVSFTIPDKSNAGAELSEITKVVVSRTDGEGEVTVVKTLTGEDATPGKQVSFVNEVPQAGMYSYTVVSTLDEVESKPATTDAAWIGFDMPKTPTTGPSFSKNDDGTIKITWSAPSSYTVLGEHKGFVDRENLVYGVYRVSQVSLDNITKIGETTETTYTDDLSNIEWDKYKYAISYINGDNESEAKQGYSTGISGGKIASWPYKPDLSDENYFDSLETHGCSHNDGVYFGNIVTSFDERSIYFPPFDVTDSDKLNYKLNLQVSKVKEESEESLEVYLCTLDAPATYDMRKVIKAVYEGENNKTLVQGLTVNALTDAPENKEVAVKIPQTGRYRVALKLTSPDTQGLRIHALTLAADTSTGVDELGAAGDAIAVRGGELLLPENTTVVCVYALDGMMVVKAGAVTTLDLSDLARGLYMVRVETADNNILTAKIRN